MPIDAAEVGAIPPQGFQERGIYLVDTAELFAALSGNSHERRKLEIMCQLLGVEGANYFHNAGNDAHVIPDAFYWRGLDLMTASYSIQWNV